MLPKTIERLDARAGERLEAAIRRHHRRRLARIAKLEQLDPPNDGELWCVGEPRPRPGCALDVLIDGRQALAAIADAISRARDHVHISGWHLDPWFGLTRDPQSLPLRELLAELSERVDVRVLLWAGAPLPVFTPDRRQVRRDREELVRGSRIRCALDAKERPMHCHHEKLVLVDGEIAFVGGIDLTSLGGDRYDTSEHPMRSRLGWHDAAARLRGPAVADVAAHFASRWREVTGETLEHGAVPAAAGATTVQVVRTIPERVYDFQADGDFRILEAYTRALRSARSLIYLESQFLWSSQIVQLLAAKLRDSGNEGLRLVVVLPARPNNGADMTRGQLGVLVGADRGAERFLAATLCARSGGLSAPLYVHAKIGIVDDVWLTIGSANLNEHSLFNDTELNLIACDPALAREVRLRLWAEHLERPAAELDDAPARIVDDLWRPTAREQLARRRRGEAPTHHMQELPGVSRRSMALLGPLQGLFVDG